MAEPGGDFWTDKPPWWRPAQLDECNQTILRGDGQIDRCRRKGCVEHVRVGVAHCGPCDKWPAFYANGTFAEHHGHGGRSCPNSFHAAPAETPVSCPVCGARWSRLALWRAGCGGCIDLMRRACPTCKVPMGPCDMSILPTLGVGLPGWHKARETAFRPGRFRLEGLERSPLFEGFTRGTTWNGFACPHFELAVARQVLEWLVQTEGGHVETTPEGDLLLVAADTTQGEPVTFLPTPEGLIDLGGSWAWSEEAPDDLFTSRGGASP